MQDFPLPDLALQAAGTLTMLAAVAHGVLGETRVFAHAQIAPPRLRLLIRLVWQSSALAWFGLGVLLAVAPSLHAPEARLWIILVAVAVLATAAASNAWATRGRHFGWAVLALACLLALVGR